MILMGSLPSGAMGYLWRSSFSPNYRPVIATAFLRHLRPTLTLGVEFADMIQIHVDDVEPSRTAGAEVRNEFDRQKWFVPVSKTFSSDAPNNVPALW